EASAFSPDGAADSARAPGEERPHVPEPREGRHRSLCRSCRDNCRQRAPRNRRQQNNLRQLSPKTREGDTRPSDIAKVAPVAQCATRNAVIQRDLRLLSLKRGWATEVPRHDRLLPLIFQTSAQTMGPEI